MIPTDGVKLGKDIDGYTPSINDTHNMTKDELDELLEADEASGETETTDESAEGNDGDDDTDLDAVSGDEKDKADDLDEPKIPRRRLNEVLEERNELRERVAVLDDRLNRLEQAAIENPEEAIDYIDQLLAADDEQVIIDAINDEPKEFISNLLSRARTEAARELRQETDRDAYNRQLSDALESFANEHDGFKDYAFNEKTHEKIRMNPHHNVISLYMEEQIIPDLQAQMDEAVKKAKAEGKKEAIKELKAKRSAAVLDGGSSNANEPTGNDELQDDFMSHGENVRDTIVARLKRRRDSRA